MSMKNSNDTIDLPTCSAVPQPTAPPRTPTNPRTVVNGVSCVVGWCPRVLRRGSTAATLLGLRVRIPLGSCVCYILSVIGHCDGRSPVLRRLIDCGALESDGRISDSRPRPTGTIEP